jgi:site-specific DNA recombinase
MEEVLPSVTRHEPMQMQRCGNEMRLMIEGQGAPINIDPILIKTIARAHVWSQELLTSRASSMAEIASRHGVSDSYVKKIMPLAFLAPDIMDAIIAGKQPAKINTQWLIRGMEIPSEWQEQCHALGFKA